MPFSTKPLVRLIAKLSRCLSLALLPALASEAHAVSQPQRKQNVRSAVPGAATPKAGAVPYLAALGPLPLRFARPGPEPTEEPPAPPEPKPVAPPALPPAVVKKPEDATPETLPDTPAAGDKDKPTETPGQAPKPEPESFQPALPILPDDTKRELHPEDVLPFFRYPNASGDNRVEVVVPITNNPSQPNRPPPSSATFQQK